MKIAHVQTPDNQINYGIVHHDTVEIVRGDIFGSLHPAGRSFPLHLVKLLAPVTPANVLCFGRNYKAHAEEGGDAIPSAPLLFIKASSCIIGPEEPIIIPRAAPAQVDYEAELVVVIKKAARNIDEAEALDYVLGYTCGNDVSARDCQTGDGQWARAKSFDTFGPIGPWIETDLNPENILVEGRLNGKTMQSANTSLMIFSVRHLISYLSQGMTLLPGTLLFTGTPAGVGAAQKPPVWLKPGDVFEVEIEGIGVLKNPVIEEIIAKP
jgi:2-keto-4-pentenoate hydratase/2-oxohepta-3-ene-1,7-dioic acid hydratase in catechol pathway